MSRTQEELAKALGLTWFDYQLECMAHWSQTTTERLCLYYRTGAGKSITSLACLATTGHTKALVIAPPVTHKAWLQTGEKLGIELTVMSHAKFRMPTTKLAQSVPVIADEVHLFGGHAGKGWKKLDTLAANLKAPIILCSATPNYNDAERCYCIQHILGPNSCRGGFLNFIYQHCTTQQNPFGLMPLVSGFLRFANAAEYLDSLKDVKYLPDIVQYSILDVDWGSSIPSLFSSYNFNMSKMRFMASLMERKHEKNYVDRILNDKIRFELMDWLEEVIGSATTPVIIYCASSRIATVLLNTCLDQKANAKLVTGKTSAKQKLETLESFKRGEIDILIGTGTIATGTDGLDKVCDTLILFHDTEDDAHRRQVIGRILPRGADSDATDKRIFRLVFE